MQTLQIIFWISIGILFYTYLGYGFVIYLLAKFKKPIQFQELSDEDLPEVTHLIAAYNEQDLIEEKIINCYKIDYPKSKINTVIVADGSTDHTVEIIKKYPFVKLFYSPARKGKLAAVDRVMKEVESPITIFSDANSMLNPEAIKLMVRHFEYNTVGAVAGEKVVINDVKDDAASAGEGLYWKYESFLKKLDYRLHSVVGAAGELFAVRTFLFKTPDRKALIEDFLITMNIAEQGYRVAYESEAKASEYGSANIDEEMKRKVRIGAGGLQSVWMLRKLLNPIKHGLLTFQYVSHRALRWTLAPLALLFAFLSNVMLVQTQEPLYILLFIGQALFYLLAIAGFYAEHQKLKFKLFFVPFYFAFMNFSMYLGFIKLVSGKFNVKWEKAERRSYNANPSILL